MDTLKGAINILTDKTDPAHPVYKILYPRTSAEQVVDLNDAIQDIVGDTVTVSGSLGSRKTVIGDLQADSISTSTGNAINATVTGAVAATKAINDANNRAITSYAMSVSTISGSANTINVRTGAEVNAGTAGTNIVIDNVQHAAQLTSAKKINGISFDGSADIADYGVCDTASSTVTKTASVTGFNLVTGASAKIKFTNANTASNATLSINETTAKALYFQGAAVSNSLITAGSVIIVVYDGTNYNIVGGAGSGSGTSRTAIAGTPSPTGDLTYDGTVKAPFADVDTAYITLSTDPSYTYSATNVGTYEALFTPGPNCYWASTGLSDPITVTWSITPKIITVPVQSGTVTYTGSAQTPTWTNPDSAYINAPTVTAQTNVASNYTATFTLKDTVNTAWSGATGSAMTSAMTCTWAISKATINSTDWSVSGAPSNLGYEETLSLTISRPGTGSVSVTSTNGRFATVGSPSSASGDVVIGIVGAQGGADTITVSLSGDSNYNVASNATTKTFPLTVFVKAYGIYYKTAGGHVKGTNWQTIDGNNSSITIA